MTKDRIRTGINLFGVTFYYRYIIVVYFSFLNNRELNGYVNSSVGNSKGNYVCDASIHISLNWTCPVDKSKRG